MGRQPNGRPSINQNKDKKFHTWVTVGMKPDGTPRRKHVKRKTATGVSNELDEMEKVRPISTKAGNKGETAAEWFMHYLENIVRPNRSDNTYTAYEPIFRLHVIPQIGGYRLAGTRHLLEPDHLDQLYAYLRTPQGGSLAPSYVLQVHRVISRALKVAVRRGRAWRNPCDLMDPPPAGDTQIEPLSLDDAQAVVVAAVHDEQAARWILGLALGYRQGEALGVRWSYLDLEAATIRPKQQIQRQTWKHGCADPRACAAPHCAKKAKRKCPPTECKRHPGRKGCPPPCPPDCTDHARLCPQKWGGGLVEVPTKSKTGRGKPLPMPPLLVELFRVHRERQIRQYAELGRPWDPKGFCFTNAFGRPIDPRRDHAAWEALLRTAGVDDARLHAARHTAGTLMVAGGTDISVVQELLRHASILTTRIYVDVAETMKRQAVEKIAASLFDGDIMELIRALSVAKPAAEADR